MSVCERLTRDRVLTCPPTVLAAGLAVQQVPTRGRRLCAVGSAVRRFRISKHVLMVTLFVREEGDRIVIDNVIGKIESSCVIRRVD